MANKKAFNRTVSFKVNEEQDHYINKLKADGISLRDVLKYYKDNTTNPRQKLLNREKYLIDRITELEKELERTREDLKEVRIDLGKTPTDNQETLDIMAGVTRVTERVKSKYGTKASIELAREWIYSTKGDEVLAPVISQYNVKNVETFKKEILERVKF